MSIKNNQLEVPYTTAEQTKLAGIESNAEVNAAIASQAVAEAGVDNSLTMTSLRVSQAIAAQVGAGGGEANTASNEGTGTGVFIQKTGVNLEFKTFTAGTGITFGGDAQNIIINASTGGLTDTDDLAEGTTNLYYTEARVNANASVAANTAKVSADGSVATHSDVVLTSPSNGQVLTYNGSQWVNAAATGGSALTVKDEGSTLDSNVTTIDFLGAGVSAVQNGSGIIEVTISGGGASAINDLTDVVITTPSNGQVLTYNGANWVNAAAGGSGITTEFNFTLSAAASIAGRTITGLPSGWKVGDGTGNAVTGSGAMDAVASQLSQNATDLILQHGETKNMIEFVCVSIDPTGAPFGLDNNIVDFTTGGANQTFRTDSTKAQTHIKEFQTDVGNLEAVIYCRFL